MKKTDFHTKLRNVNSKVKASAYQNKTESTHNFQ